MSIESRKMVILKVYQCHNGIHKQKRKQVLYEDSDFRDDADCPFCIIDKQAKQLEEAKELIEGAMREAGITV